MRHLQVMVKPASSNCNLRCSYCFYEDECKKQRDTVLWDHGFGDSGDSCKKSVGRAEAVLHLWLSGRGTFFSRPAFFPEVYRIYREI